MRQRAILAVVIVIVSLVPLAAPAAPAAAVEDSSTHLDQVAAALEQVSPQGEGALWEDTSGNHFPGDDGAWLLQTPDCWGDPACTGSPPLGLPGGTTHFLAQIQETIGSAEESVDVTTLRPFPDAEFYDAVLAGLTDAFAGGDRPTVRILGGAPLGVSLVPAYTGPSPLDFRARLVTDLEAVYGPEAASFPITVASTTSSAVSWNHAKMIVADGRRAIVGGHNLWHDSYVVRKVSDLSVVVDGPAAASSARLADVLWAYSCGASAVWAQIAGPAGAECPATVARPAPTSPGGTRIVTAARLGRGIPMPAASALGPSAAVDEGAEDPTPLELACPVFDIALDATYADPGYDARNPGETAERALLASAERSIFISQQDLLGYCGRYDERLFDVLAQKLLDGVPTTIVVTGAFGTDYAIMGSLYDLSTVLYEVTLSHAAGDEEQATAAVCGNLRLASIRAADAPTWDGGEPFANHAKFASVDGEAFSIGSGNMYPFPLQEMNFYVEDLALVDQLRQVYLEPLWSYSRTTAVVDAGQGRCDVFGPGETPQPPDPEPGVPTSPGAAPQPVVTPRFTG